MPEFVKKEVTGGISLPLSPKGDGLYDRMIPRCRVYSPHGAV